VYICLKCESEDTYTAAVVAAAELKRNALWSRREFYAKHLQKLILRKEEEGE
jgi:hypothetical protein